MTSMITSTTHENTQTVVSSRKGLVTSNHRHASEAGAKILALGGNAIDAAIATSLAIGVVEPAMSGIAGRGYMVIHIPSRDDSIVIDGHERAPRGSNPEMFTLDDRTPIPTEPTPGWGMMPKVVDDANSDGHLAVAVPGVLQALSVAHKRYGKLEWKELFKPAIEFAEEGIEISVTFATLLASQRRKLARFPATEAIYFRDGTVLAAGERLVQSDLGKSLRKLADNGTEEFYTGSIGAAIANEIEGNGGILTQRDLEDFEPRVWNTPLSTTYRGHSVLTVPEAGGGISLLQALNILEGFDLSGLEPDDPEHVHLIIEALRLAFRDRHAYLDDPTFTKVPFSGLLSKEYAGARRSLIESVQSLATARPGDPWAFEGSKKQVPSPTSALPSDSDTTHFCVIDSDQITVSMTQSIIDAFGSGVVVPGTGILLNSAMHNFSPIAGDIRAIAPWKRSAHYGTPTIVLAPDGTPRISVGGAGGSKVTTGTLQVLLNIIDHNMDMQDAVASPRSHNEGWGTTLDSRFSSSVKSDLIKKGHSVTTARTRFGQPQFSRVNGLAKDLSGFFKSGVDIFSDAGASGLS